MASQHSSCRVCRNTLTLPHWRRRKAEEDLRDAGNLLNKAGIVGPLLWLAVPVAVILCRSYLRRMAGRFQGATRGTFLRTVLGCPALRYAPAGRKSGRTDMALTRAISIA